MMLLMGMKMSLTKKPTNPMTTNPIAVRAATLVNSVRQISVRSGRKQTGSETRRAGELVAVLTLAVRLVAALDEADAVLGKLAGKGVDHGVDGVHGCCRREGEISEPMMTTRSRA